MVWPLYAIRFDRCVAEVAPDYFLDPSSRQRCPVPDDDVEGVFADLFMEMEIDENLLAGAY